MATSAELMSKQQYKDLNGSQIFQSINTGKITFDKVEQEASWENSKGQLDQAAKEQLIIDFASRSIILTVRINVPGLKTMEWLVTPTVSGDASVLSSMTPMLDKFNKIAAEIYAKSQVKKERCAINQAVFINLMSGVRYTLNIKPFPSPDATATAAAGSKPKA
jgi:hypothetical protein